MPETKTLKRPIPAPAEYAGKWVAWDRNRTRILASGTDVAAVRAAAVAAGESDPLMQKVAPLAHQICAQ